MSTAPNEKEPLAIDLLLTEDERRRPITVEAHHQFRESLSVTGTSHDEIDAYLEELDQTTVDPYECHGPSRRSDKSLASFLDLIDKLPISNDGKETTR